VLIPLATLLESPNFSEAAAPPVEVRRRVTARRGGAALDLDVAAPPSWSDRAVSVVASKYFAPGEASVGQMVDRVLDAVRDFAVGSNRLSGAEAGVLVRDARALVMDQALAFNSPVWFNVGRVEKPQASACFINKVDDSMESILDWIRTEGTLFKQGSGSGVSLSALRPAGAPLSGGGSASGPVSFARAADAVAGSVKSGGRTRRAAKMVVLDAWHPDALEFVRCKAEAEKRARALAAAGFSAHFDDPDGAYASVGFQNANHSLRVSDEFMARAVCLPDSDEGRLLRAAAEAAWECGDPGLQFDGQIQREHTCPGSGRIAASNPCSEFFFLDETACNLASLNLAKFIGPDGPDYRALSVASQLALVVMELLVDMAGYPTERIARMSAAYRPLGLGYSNLGGYLVALGLPYGGGAGRAEAARVTALVTAAAWYTSAGMAQRWGVFPGALDIKYPEEDVAALANHVRELADRTLRLPQSDRWEDLVASNMATARDAVLERGARNAQVTVLAPAGTISLMMDCETTGVEPMFAPRVEKSFVGGGTADVGTRGSPCELLGLRCLGASDPSERPDVFAYAAGPSPLPPEAHVLMVAAVQGFLSGGVSKTVNMPASATAEDVAAVFELAWREKCKAVAVYRDGSKGSQPLTVAGAAAGRTESQRARLPETRGAFVHKFSVGGTEGYLTVGLYDDGSPGEVFLNLAKAGSTVSGFADCMAMMMSIALQRGAPLEELVDKLRGVTFAPYGVTGDSDPSRRLASSVPDYVARWLRAKFLEGAAETGAADGRACGNCGSGDVVQSGSCWLCVTCGDTTGCG
jgi:ribonucleoside-diphosphate reductase alpha chain